MVFDPRRRLTHVKLTPDQFQGLQELLRQGVGRSLSDICRQCLTSQLPNPKVKALDRLIVQMEGLLEALRLLNENRAKSASRG